MQSPVVVSARTNEDHVIIDVHPHSPDPRRRTDQETGGGFDDLAATEAGYNGHSSSDNRRGRRGGKSQFRMTAVKWIHVIPTIVFVCFFILWWCSYPGLPVDPSSNAGTYDYFQLIMQYQPYICSGLAKPHTPYTCVKQPKPEFTIHGLWPTNHTGSSKIPCKGQSFTPKLVLTQQRNVLLDTYWPDLLRSSTGLLDPKRYWLWKHEWETHGTCVDKLTQLDYFDATLDIGEKIHKTFKSAKIVAQGKLISGNTLNNTVFQATGAYPSFRCIPNAANPTNFQLAEIVMCVRHLPPGSTTPNLENCTLTASHKCAATFWF